MPSWRSLLLCIVAPLCLCAVAFGQRDLGTVSGVINDSSGAAVPNAKIVLTNDATGVANTSQTNESGTYNIPALTPGTYTATVEAAGFQKAQQKNILVNPGEPIAVDITLQIGASTQTVEVTAAAPLLQTETPAMGANLNSSEVSQAPLGGQRTFTYLARLSPGVVPAEPGARDSLGGGFSANGVRSNGENNFLLNGVDNNVNVIDFLNQTAFVIGPSVEAIGNMQVVTSGASAEYGRAAGGIVDVSLKSGTNQLHGTLFEVFQNTVLNANRWENNTADKDRNPYKQNQFGVTLGGPIIKNRLFVFGDYQGTRIATAGGSVQNLGYGGFYTIPTQAMVNGDFSGLLGKDIGNGILQNQIFDPKTTTCTSGCAPGSLSPLAGATPVYNRTAFAGNIIPVTAMDPASRKIASLYPATNQLVKPGNIPQNDYYTVTPGAMNQDQGDARVDYRYNDSNSIFGTVSWSNTLKSSTQPFQGILDGSSFNGVGEQDLGRNGMISWTHIASPTLVNEARVGFTRMVTTRTQGNADVDAFSQVGIQGYNPTGAAALNGGLPYLNLNRYSQVGGNNWLPTTEYNNEWDLIDNVSVTKGTHSFKFGSEFRELHFPFFQVPYPHGEMDFSRNETSFPSNGKSSGINGTYTADTGDELASFLLGSLNSGQISTTNFISSTKKAIAFYGQDSWKATSKLTLNLGVRYELFSPIGEQFARQSNFNLDNMTLYIPGGPNSNAPLPGNFSSLFPNVRVSRGEVGPYLIPWDKLDIGPRMGFAYNVLPKTVIRGFYGIFYGGEENQGGSPNRGESAPFNISPLLGRPGSTTNFQPNPYFGTTGGVTNGFPINVFTGVPVTSLQFRTVAENFRNPMVQEWNLTMQQQLPAQMVFEVGYAGNHQSHQLLNWNNNFCPTIFTANPAITCNALRIQPEVGTISNTSTFGFGNYNAMTASLRKRLTAGLQFQAAYTYGHALANSGTPLSGSTNIGALDPTNYATSYSNASWDIRHNFTTTFNYDIPFGKGRQFGASVNRWVDAFAGGWQLNGILSLRTGVPYTLGASGCQIVSDNSKCLPQIISGSYNDAPAGGRTPDEWFNTANFAAPAALSQGNVGLQSNYGPPTRTLDFSIFKSFAITERYALQFRAETTNIFNTPQFSIPDANLQDANFGRITSTSAGSERHIQFQLRLQF
jgi:hypothetical protein